MYEYNTWHKLRDNSCKHLEVMCYIACSRIVCKNAVGYIIYSETFYVWYL